MADRYKWLAKCLFIVQLLVAWSIVVISTLYTSSDGRITDDCAEGEDCAGVDWWIVSDSTSITMLAEVIFFLTVGVSFLISFDSYLNAKAQDRPFQHVLP